MSQGKFKTMPMQIFFGGVGVVYYGIVQGENTHFTIFNICVWVPEVGNTADTLNPTWDLPRWGLNPRSLD